nr:vegetative cell wall protein gp1-like [Aegilops tauschii subsp. strangulata]
MPGSPRRPSSSSECPAKSHAAPPAPTSPASYIASPSPPPSPKALGFAASPTSHCRDPVRLLEPKLAAAGDSNSNIVVALLLSSRARVHSTSSPLLVFISRTALLPFPEHLVPAVASRRSQQAILVRAPASPSPAPQAPPAGAPSPPLPRAAVPFLRLPASSTSPPHAREPAPAIFLVRVPRQVPRRPACSFKSCQLHHLAKSVAVAQGPRLRRLAKSLSPPLLPLLRARREDAPLLLALTAPPAPGPASSSPKRPLHQPERPGLQPAPPTGQGPW